MGKQGSVPQVIRVTFGAFLVPVDENNFSYRTGDEQGVCGCGSHQARSDDGDSSDAAGLSCGLFGKLS
jgi:hypothetical protein